MIEAIATMIFTFLAAATVLVVIGADYPFNDPSLSWEERVDDLAGRLTLEEMTAQMANGGRLTHAPGIDRLGIDPYPWGAECLRGDVQAGPATAFPQALGLAATFSKEVIFNVSQATGIEVRAKYNNYSSHGDYGQHTSASCWSPVINIMRDPRWGRNQETYGEDPYMSGELAAAYVRGLQGDHPRYVRANAGCKHFDVYGGPENIPESRHSFNAKVSERDLRMTFLPAFQRCVEAGSLSIMCSYNSVNGIPACANKKLLTDILRKEWGFNGYVISDEGAIEDIMDAHNYTKTKPETAAASVKAGCNLEDGPYYTPPYFNAITDAVKQGLLNESVVREAVKPLFYTRMKLGLFDPPDHNPYAKLDPAVVVQSAEHRFLSLQTAMRSFVLLKNDNKFLPLPSGKTFGQVAIVGPMIDNVDGIFGGYSPDPDPKYIITPLKGLSSLGKTIKSTTGCESQDPHCNNYNQTDVKQTVIGSDIVIVCLGTGAAIEAESNDRSDINFPGKQLQVLQDAVMYASGKPIILLLFNAGPIDISWALQQKNIPVVLECFFPAQSAGDAIRKVIFMEGPTANPAGRLPSTWPVSADQYPPITDYTMENRTYRYLEGDVLFPFGFGLSYTTFKYRTLDVRPSIVRYDTEMLVDVYVENSGPFDGEEVVQLYASWMSPSLPTPKLQLVGFDRYYIPKGYGVTATFKVKLEQLAVWDDDNDGFQTLKGHYMMYAGGQQPNQTVNVGSNTLSKPFEIVL